MNRTQQRGICSRIRDIRISIFGHVRRLQESVLAHEALHLAVNTRAGQRPDDMPDWKRPRGRPRHTWNDRPAGGRRRAHCRCCAWDMASDREVWTPQRPVAGQGVQ